jgi:hypothetical protein
MMIPPAVTALVTTDIADLITTALGVALLL